MGLCKACKREHPAGQRCEVAARLAARLVGSEQSRNVTQAKMYDGNVTCAECDRLRARLAEVEAGLKQIKDAGARRVKAYRQRRAVGK